MNNKRPYFHIGVTGAYASGKDTVCRVFQQLGFKIIDFDKVGHRFLQDETVRSKLLSAFGDSIFAGDGRLLRRQRLSPLVFGSPAKLKKLNSIIHPPMKQWLKNYLDTHTGQPVIINAALLFEMSIDAWCGTTICVAASKKTIYSHALKRSGLTPEQVDTRLKSQLSPNEKANLADYIIENNGTLTTTTQQVKQLWTKLQKRHAHETTAISNVRSKS